MSGLFVRSRGTAGQMEHGSFKPIWLAVARMRAQGKSTVEFPHFPLVRYRLGDIGPLFQASLW
jgi:hypothetical protein